MTVSTHTGAEQSLEGGSGNSRGLKSLIGSMSGDVQLLVRGTVELGKAEMRESGKAAGIAGGLAAAALVLLTGAGIMTLFFLAYALVALGLSQWLAFLIVALVLTVIAAVLLLVARAQTRRIQPPKRTIAAATQTLEALRGDGAGH